MSEFHNINKNLNYTCLEYLHKVESIKSKLEFNFNYKIYEIFFSNKVMNVFYIKYDKILKLKN